MLRLERNNLQSFCRTCLDCLTSSAEDVTASSVNIREAPNLTKLLILCTTLNINEDADEAYPQQVCLKCYMSLQEIQRFRDMALQSNEVIRRIVEESSDSVVTSNENKAEHVQLAQAKCEDPTDEDFQTDHFEASQPQLSSSYYIIQQKEMEFDEFLDNSREIKIDTGMFDINSYENPAESASVKYMDSSGIPVDNASTSKDAAKRKLIVDENETKTFKCSFEGCTREFKSTSALKSHIRGSHQAIRECVMNAIEPCVRAAEERHKKAIIILTREVQALRKELAEWKYHHAMEEPTSTTIFLEDPLTKVQGARPKDSLKKARATVPKDFFDSDMASISYDRSKKTNVVVPRDVFKVNRIMSMDTFIPARVIPIEPFSDIDDFLNFEARLHADEIFFRQLEMDFASIPMRSDKKFVKTCWRQMLEDNVAERFSWRGTEEKKSVRKFRTTAALKRAKPMKNQTIRNSKNIGDVLLKTKRMTNLRKQRKLGKELAIAPANEMFGANQPYHIDPKNERIRILPKGTKLFIPPTIETAEQRGLTITESFLKHAGLKLGVESPTKWLDTLPNK